jgi:methylglutaconyl-CoA hydratase
MIRGIFRTIPVKVLRISNYNHTPCRFFSSTPNITSTDLILDIEPLTKVAVLSLNRQQGRNAFSKNMLQDFKKIITFLHDLESTKDRINCLIIKSDVEKVFCAGADLKERIQMADNEVGPFVSSLRDTLQLLAILPFPTIAAMEGVALGGGLELALACDIRIAGSNAKMGLPETSLAIIPGAGGTQRLARTIGVAKAKELIFTSKIVTSQEAYAIGLVNESVAAGSAYIRAVEMANEIATTKGPIGLRMAKQAIDGGIDLDLPAGLAVERDAYEKVIYTSDRREGLLSFTEKRKPAYTGN